MYKRLSIISIASTIALIALFSIGLHSINVQTNALRDSRRTQFFDIAEQIRLDIKRKLDTLLQNEQKRPYTDYQYDFIPIAYNNAFALLRSPLGNQLEHGLAFGHFQIASNGQISAPFLEPDKPATKNTEAYIENIKRNLLPTLNTNGPVETALKTVKETPLQSKDEQGPSKEKQYAKDGKSKRRHSSCGTIAFCPTIFYTSQSQNDLGCLASNNT